MYFRPSMEVAAVSDLRQQKLWLACHAFVDFSQSLAEVRRLGRHPVQVFTASTAPPMLRFLKASNLRCWVLEQRWSIGFGMYHSHSAAVNHDHVAAVVSHSRCTKPLK